MKEALSSFDVTACVKEMQTIVGGHLDKAYHPDKDHLVLAVRLPRGGGKRFLHFVVGKWLYLSDDAAEMPQQPSDFAMMLRKRISNARVEAVRQQGFDRIAVISLEKDGAFDLVLEIFGEGNAILAKDGLIVQPLKSHTWKHRDVRARKPLAFPPPVQDPSQLSPDAFLQMLKDSDTDIVRTLATRLNLGGRYSEEVCARIGARKSKKAADVDLEEAGSILNSVLKMKTEASESGGAYVVLNKGRLEDVVPIHMRVYESFDLEEFSDFSTAVKNYVSRIPAKEKEAETGETQVELARLNRQLARQEAAVRSLQDQGRETQILGDFLFARYSEVSTILSKARDSLLCQGDMKDIPGFVSYDQKDSMVTVDIHGSELELDIKGSVESNAQRYYEEAKRMRRKLEGALSAVQETREAAETLKEGHRIQEKSAKARHKPTKRFWFERYRWFISSEGAIVLGGKDAKSNDILVKKHLDAGDRYAHADVHGAPSVVVKMREGVTEATLEEACEFAVANSKAWNANVGSAAGYWVLPEQVSKTPQSGEFLAKGAFVIRGKRNYTGKLEIKLGVGEIEFEGEKKVMAGPERAVKSRSGRYVIIRPGRKNKNDFAKKLSDTFGVPVEEIQSVLPPGGVDIVEEAGISTS